MAEFLTDEEEKLAALLKGSVSAIAPLVYEQGYDVEYILSHGENSPFFVGLAFEKLLGTRCRSCKTSYATPRPFCMNCGGPCAWVELPKTGKIHTFTECHFGSEAFLKETPYLLTLIEFEGFDTLFLSRLKAVEPARKGMGLIGARVAPKFNPALKEKLEFMRKRKIDYKRIQSLPPEEKERIKKMEISVSDVWFTLI